jgi:hypothetical protein
MLNGIEIGNNGSQLVYVLHNEELLKDGMSVEEIADIARPYMAKPHHLNNDNLWEDVFATAEELGYKLFY